MRFSLGLVASALSLAASAAVAQTGGETALTMDDAVRLAVANHPVMAAARERIGAARYRRRASAAGPNTELSWNPFFGSETVGGSDEQLVVAQRLDLSGRRRLGTDVARAHLSGAQAEASVVRQELAFEVKTAYVELLLARELVALAESLVQTATQFRNAAQRQFALGNVPRIEVERAELELARAEKERSRLQADSRVREVELDELMGREPSVPVVLAESLKFEPVEVDEQDGLARGLAERPELRATEAELRARRSEVSLSAAERRPDLLVEGRRNELDQGGRNALVLGLTFPLLDRGEIRNGVRAARADVAEQEALQDAMKRRITREVTTALTHVRQARELAQRYEQDLVPRTERVTQTIQRGFDAGASTILDVLDAQRTLRSVQTEYRQAIADYRKALAELQRATGEAFQAQE